MTYLQALYGSQHKEITEKGRDGAKGRTNGNMFLAAFIIVVLIVIFLVIFHFIPQPENTTGMSGKAIGKLLAIPVFAIVYFIIIYTVGTEANYNKIIAEFYQFPPEEQAKANQKILVPFFIVLAAMLGLAIF